MKKVTKVGIFKWEIDTLDRAAFVVNEANLRFKTIKFWHYYDETKKKVFVETMIGHHGAMWQRVALKFIGKVLTFLMREYSKDYDKTIEGT